MNIAEWKICPQCGSQLRFFQNGGRHVECSACGFSQWENPLPTTLILPIDRDGRVLLVRRAHVPRAGYWDTLGGFLDVDESAEECARREFHEETGITRSTIEYLGSYPSTYGDTGRKTIGFAFVCKIDSDADRVQLSDENTEFAWFSADALPELAFKDGSDSVRDLFSTTA